ncbi:hypothetical protein D9M70_452790 [compost metagenome]
MAEDTQLRVASALQREQVQNGVIRAAVVDHYHFEGLAGKRLANLFQERGQVLGLVLGRDQYGEVGPVRHGVSVN